MKNKEDMVKIGDRVKFLNDVGGGVVTAFIGGNMVKVEDQDGFEVPYPVSELINIDDPALNKGGVAEPEEDDDIEEKEDKEIFVTQDHPVGERINGKDSPDFYFCCVPMDQNNPLGGAINLYFVNDSNFTVQYRYAHYIDEKYKTVKYGVTGPNTKQQIESIGESDLSTLPDYFFQLLYFFEEEREWHTPISKKIKINPVKFYKERSFQTNQFFKQKALVYQITENILNTEIDKLTDDDFRKVIKAKEKKEVVKNLSKKKVSDIIEVDLHIHELIDTTNGLSNREMLEIQLEKVEREMRSAIDSKAKRIVFIHGVGQGVLKQEIAKLLKSKFSKYDFQDASFREYGYGATMVILRRK